MKTGKRFRKARPSLGTRKSFRRFLRLLDREMVDYWRIESHSGSVPGRLIPTSKLGRGRWRR